MTGQSEEAHLKLSSAGNPATILGLWVRGSSASTPRLFEYLNYKYNNLYLPFIRILTYKVFSQYKGLKFKYNEKK